VGDLLPVVYSQPTEQTVFGSLACMAANQTDECQIQFTVGKMSFFLGHSHCFNRISKCFCAAEDIAEGLWRGDL